MRIEKTNSQNFKAIDYKAVNMYLYDKRLMGKALVDFHNLLNEQSGNLNNIVLKKNWFGILKASIVSPEGNLLHKEQEGFFNGIFRTNPIEFINKLCEKANSYKQ